MWPSNATALTKTLSERKHWFKESHGVENPSFFWKIIQAKTIYPEDGSRIAFWMPNLREASAKRTGDYVVSIATLEARLAEFGHNETFNMTQAEKDHTPATLWKIPFGCNRG